MSQIEREVLIRYIKKHDTYNYGAVDFKYYTDEDLQNIKKMITGEYSAQHRADRNQQGTQRSAAV